MPANSQFLLIPLMKNRSRLEDIFTKQWLYHHLAYKLVYPFTIQSSNLPLGVFSLNHNRLPHSFSHSYVRARPDTHTHTRKSLLLFIVLTFLLFLIKSVKPNICSHGITSFNTILKNKKIRSEITDIKKLKRNIYYDIFK